MSKEKVREKTMFKQAALVIASMLLMLMMIPFQTFADSGITKYVSNSAELQSALADKTVEKIIFNEDIAATSKMEIAAKRTSSQLIIDGNGHTFTERYTKLSDASYGIYLTSLTTIDTITIQNMNITGQNGCGTIYTTKGINQIFKNVVYYGPKMVDNNEGSVRIEDSEIHIGQYNNSYNGQVAEVNSVILAGDVKITKMHHDKYEEEIFKLKKTGAGITVEDGANIEITNNHKSNSCDESGFIESVCSYYFKIGNDAEFTYNGKYLFEDSIELKTFTMGTNSKFNVTLDNGLGERVLKASDTINIGNGSRVGITINGTSKDYVMYAYNNITIGKNAIVDIKTGDVASDYVMKSYKGNINVGENASVNIETGAVTGGHVVKAYHGNIEINNNAKFVVNSYGAMKTDLMWVKRNLIVRDGAVLDLIANKNTAVCCNYVLYVDGCTETYRSTVIYDNPERVLFYNDNKSGTCLSFAAYLGNYTSIDFKVYGTEYWNSAKTTGGVNVLENPDYEWCQDPNQYGNYHVCGASKCCATSFNNYFKATDYVGNSHGSGTMNADKYYFGKVHKNCKYSGYEVCLWNGKKTKETEYTVRYLEQGTDIELAPSESFPGLAGETVSADAKDIAGYDLVSTTPQSATLVANSGANVITFYYTKKETTYTIRYLEEGTNTELASDKTGSGKVGDTVTADAENITGYDLTNTTPQSMTLVEDGNSNVIIFYYKAQVKLTYVFNNDIHTWYWYYGGTTYEMDEEETYSYASGSIQTAKQLDEVFPDYIGKKESCEFLGWSTQSSGAIEYVVGDPITVNSDVKLYGIWRSCQPTVDDISEGDTTISGRGVLYGMGASGSYIDVTLPNGVQWRVLVKSSGLWVLELNLADQSSLIAGASVTVVQIEDGKEPSDPLTVIVQP